MVCPFCLHKKTEVYNSRPTKRIAAIWRRRRCSACKKEFTTREAVDSETVLKVKEFANTKTPVSFSRATLLLSILKVCDHLPDKNSAYWLCDTIEQSLLRLSTKQEGVILKTDITAASLAALKHFDTPAFIKYLSYHSKNIDNREIKRQLKR